MALSAPVLALPFVGSLPDQPPEAAQLVAFAEDQLSIADPPLLTLVGVALRLTVGATTAAFTVIANAGSEADALPSLTLITMPALLPDIRRRGRAAQLSGRRVEARPGGVVHDRERQAVAGRISRRRRE